MRSLGDWTGVALALVLAVGCGDGGGDDGSLEAGGPPGVAGGPCYPNATCNAGLDCTSGVCVDPSAAAGSAGGACYPNNTCDTGLACEGGVCVLAGGEPSVDTDGGIVTDGGLPDGAVDAGPDGTGRSTEATIGPEGGVIEHEGARVTIPAGALDAATVLRITSLSSAATTGYARFSPVYRFEPAGTEFAVPAIASIAYDGDARRATLFWTYPDRSSFERVGGLESGGRVQGEVTHFSEGFVGDGIEYTDSPDLSDACGTPCASGGTCESGTCECPGADGRDCGGICRDVAVDVSNCGACSVSCGANATACTSGRCLCAPGWTGARCDEPVCAGGCGTDRRCVAPDRCECNDGFVGPTCSIGVARGFAFALINPGTFSMGSPAGELGRGSDETQHTVTLTNGFLMQSTEVTQGQWKSLSGGLNPSCFQATSQTSCSTSNANDSGPVEQVDWYSAVAFANALSVREGLSACYTLAGCSDSVNGWKDGMHSGCTGATFAGLSCTGYRLPTESEWEYAARAGTTTATYAGNLTSTECGDRTLLPIAWFCGNSGSRTQSVAQKTPNAWGLYDMLGNVWEWTWDIYWTYPAMATDPTGPTTGLYRVLRGGGWSGNAFRARAARRFGNGPDLRLDGTGFRLARSLP